MNKDEVNVLKGIAIIGVVGLHFLSAMPWLGTYTGKIFEVSVVVDMFLRFSVPMFVALSGYALSARYFNQKIGLKEFYVHRVAKLIPLYLFWTAVIFLVAQLYSPWAGFINASGLWERIFLGRGDYHLYFVPMILQLYLLFPLVLWLVRRWEKAIIVISFIIQIIIYKVYGGLGLSDQVRYVFFFSWFFYFILGIFLSHNRGWMKSKYGMPMALGVLMLAGGFVWAVAQAFLEILFGQNIIDVTTFTTFPILVFASGFILTAVILIGKFRAGMMRRFLVFCGMESYVIYLSHTVVLRILIGLGADPAAMILPAGVVVGALLLTRYLR